jgi:hypothetical protein
LINNFEYKVDLQGDPTKRNKTGKKISPRRNVGQSLMGQSNL